MVYLLTASGDLEDSKGISLFPTENNVITVVERLWDGEGGTWEVQVYSKGVFSSSVTCTTKEDAVKVARAKQGELV